MPQAIFESTRNPPKSASINSVIVWYVYQIRRKSDDRSYVGVTQRPIEVRKTLHLYFARRPNHNHRRGGLAEAIRAAERSGLVAAEEFEISLLETCTDPEVARSLERLWIAKLNTAFPSGFNLAKGGASLGGPGNARPVTISRPG
ncbi:MAG: GIY-YIG nuclease family protein, partial [bacterium]